jgi:MYXO-CTERM domain-containing protein
MSDAETSSPVPRRVLVQVAAVCGVLLAAPALRAAPSRGEIHAVFWSAEADERPLADNFFRCLTRGTSFSGGWSGEFGIATVVYDGSVVLPGTTPARLSLGALAQLLIQAFDKGELPAPVSGVANEYISFTPSTSIVGNLCTGPTAGCGEHSFRNTYKGVSFDVASVPLGKCNCHNMWDSESKKTTEVAEHETAEGLARLAGAGFETGDRCELLKENLTCCGNSYQVQQLAGARGATSCEPITSSGNAAACMADAPADAGGDDSGSRTPDVRPPGGASGDGSTGGGSGGGAPPGTAPSSDAAPGGSSPIGAGGKGATPPGSAVVADAGSGDNEAGAPGSSVAARGMSAGCGCRTVPDPGAESKNLPWGAPASLGGLALLLARRRRRSTSS